MARNTDIEVRERQQRVQDEIKSMLDTVITGMISVGNFMEVQAGGILLRCTPDSLRDFESLRNYGRSQNRIPAYIDIFASRNDAKLFSDGEGEVDALQAYADWSSIKVGGVLTPGGIILGDDLEVKNNRIGSQYTERNNPIINDQLVVLGLLTLLSNSLGVGSSGEIN